MFIPSMKHVNSSSGGKIFTVDEGYQGFFSLSLDSNQSLPITLPEYSKTLN